MLKFVKKYIKTHFYCISTSAGLIDPTLAEIGSECEAARLQTQTYGLSLLAGGGLDTVADYVGNNRGPLDLFTQPDFVRNQTPDL